MITDEMLLRLLEGAGRPRGPGMKDSRQRPWFNQKEADRIVEGAPDSKALDLYRQKSTGLADTEKKARDAFLAEMLGAADKDSRISAPYRGAWAASLGAGPINFQSAPDIKENQNRTAAKRLVEIDAEKTARGAMDKETGLQGDEDKAARELYEKAMQAQQKSLYAGKSGPPDVSKFTPQKPQAPAPRPSDFGDARPDTDILLNTFGFARKTDSAFDELPDVQKKEIRGALESESSSRRAFNEVIALASQVGKEAFPTAAKQVLLAKINELRAKARVAMGFGVLSDQEMKRLDSIIPDPSNIDAKTVNSSIAVFRELRDSSRRRLEDKMLAHNIEPGVRKIINGIEAWIPQSVVGKLKNKGAANGVKEK